MIVFLCLFFVFSAFSQQQQWQYKLEGSFPTRAAPDPANPAMVNYSLDWNESASEIQGMYRDNYFTNDTPRTVTGTVTTEGRTFTIILPGPVSGVRQLVYTSSQRGAVSGSISMRTVTRDNVGAIVDDHAGFSLMTTTPAAAAAPITEDTPCTLGFGTLTNHCGIFNGLLSEVADTRNRCEVAGRSPRLELGTDMAMRFIFDYVPGVTGLPTHELGSLFPSPTSNTINVTRRECSGLPGTTFEAGNCKTLNLSGTFINQPESLIFIGTYVIADDVNGDNCSYSMNLRREVIY